MIQIGRVALLIYFMHYILHNMIEFYKYRAITITMAGNRPNGGINLQLKGGRIMSGESWGNTRAKSTQYIPPCWQSEFCSFILYTWQSFWWQNSRTDTAGIFIQPGLEKTCFLAVHFNKHCCLWLFFAQQLWGSSVKSSKMMKVVLEILVSHNMPSYFLWYKVANKRSGQSSNSSTIC